MFLENKKGDIDGYKARIGWVSFSKSGNTVYYRDKKLSRIKGGGVRGNYCCNQTGHEYWISGVRKQGDNLHHAGATTFHVDADALDEYNALKGSTK